LQLTLIRRVDISLANPALSDVQRLRPSSYGTDMMRSAAGVVTDPHPQITRCACRGPCRPTAQLPQPYVMYVLCISMCMCPRLVFVSRTRPNNRSLGRGASTSVYNTCSHISNQGVKPLSSGSNFDSGTASHGLRSLFLGEAQHNESMKPAQLLLV
jgi:hypothetical protein